MTDRITDKRLAEIDSHRLRTPTGLLPNGEKAPLYGGSEELEELLQALKAEREHSRKLRGLLVKVGNVWCEYQGDTNLDTPETAD